MFASDSVVNLRCRKRPRHNPAGTIDADANPALPSSDFIVPASPNAPRSSILSKHPRIRPEPVLPIDKLRAHVANKRKVSRDSCNSPISSPTTSKPKLKGMDPTAAALSARDATSRLCGPIQGGGLLPTSTPTQLCPTSKNHQQRQATVAAAPRRTQQPSLRSDGENKRQRRTVRFELDRNSVHEIVKTPEDLRAAWMSRQESDVVRQHIVECIVAFQVGLLDYEHDTLRGLEVHLDPELMQKKIDNCRNYTSVLLEQQRFLVSIMGHCNESILSRMSSLLSDEDRQMALDTAAADALEASRIHGRLDVDRAPWQDGVAQQPRHWQHASDRPLDRPQLASSLSGMREAGGGGDEVSPLAVDCRSVQYVLVKAQAS
jgi:hypothetical protein